MSSSTPDVYVPERCPRCHSRISFTWYDASSVEDEVKDWIPVNPHCTNQSCALSASELDGAEVAELSVVFANFPYRS